MFEAMAVACPIVLGVEGEAKALLDAAGAGIAIEPESAEKLGVAVVRLADDHSLRQRLGRQGAEYVREHYDRAKLATRYLEVLEATIVARRGGLQEKTGAQRAEITP